MGGDDFSRLNVVQIALNSTATLLGIDPANFKD